MEFVWFLAGGDIYKSPPQKLGGGGDFEIPSQVWKHSLIGSILTLLNVSWGVSRFSHLKRCVVDIRPRISSTNMTRGCHPWVRFVDFNSFGTVGKCYVETGRCLCCVTSKFLCQSASVGSLWSCQPWFLTANVTSENLFQLRPIAYWMRMWMFAKDSTQLSRNVKTSWGGFKHFFTPIIEKIPILTNIFQMGWNHHPEKVFNYILDCFVRLEEVSTSTLFLERHSWSLTAGPWKVTGPQKEWPFIFNHHSSGARLALGRV